VPENFDMDYIVLEAWYDNGAQRAYNGNLLIDNCSDIVRIEK
jgi:hypothetical protein